MLLKLSIIKYQRCNFFFDRYAISMLECTHNISRLHATKFFSYSFKFTVIREIFDEHEGLHKLIKMVRLI